MKKILMAAAAFCCAMTLTVLTACTSDNDDDPVTPPEPEDLADYTILFYGNGGANLDVNILDNVTQFYQGKTESYDRVNIVAQYKFSTEVNLLSHDVSAESAEFSGSKSLRFVVERDTAKTYETISDVLTTDMIYGEKNADLSCPDSLTHFINWAAKTCPAKHYLLILSDHGGGYVPDNELPEEEVAATRGILYDDGNNHKHFTVKSLARALSNADVRMQTIYMDACLMNTIEYQFELKDLCDYYVASTFTVPGYGGCYDILIDLLAAHPDDIETALSEYNRQAVGYWDDAMSQWYNFDYHDMIVIRTSALDAFGQKWKLFTDKLIAAYQSGDETVKQKINQITAILPRVRNESPAFNLDDYYYGIHRIAPEVIDDAFYAELDEAFKRTIVSQHNSDFLERHDLIFVCSILVCTRGHYNVCDFEEDDNGDMQFDFFYTYYPDGSFYYLKQSTQEMTPHGTWGGTLENTYQQLAFDRATGWSRWLMINEQEPPYASYADFNVDLPGVFNLE